jgi:hypothetical protein
VKTPVSPPQPTALEAFERLQPIIAVSAMVMTFLLLQPPLAVSFIGLVWVIATRLSRGQRFLGLTLTQALAWSATVYIGFVGLVILLTLFVPAPA